MQHDERPDSPSPMSPAPKESAACADRAGSRLDQHLPIPVGWVLFIVLLVLQWGFFAHFAEREITWGYPTAFDQVTYLDRSYSTFDQMPSQGPLHAFLWGLRLPVAQGVMLHSQAALLYLLLGPSRLSALTLNFLYFALFQYILLLTLRWVYTSWHLAFYGLGLLLTTTTIFGHAGSLLDFRIDFIVLCLFGILICLVIRSNLFESRLWSLSAALAAALLILFRFLTAPTVVALGCATMLLFVLRLARHKNDPGAREGILRRIRTLIGTGGIVAVLTIPAVWMDRQAIAGYYVFNITSHENKYRDLEFGVRSGWDSLTFYPLSLVRDHLGSTFLALAALTLLVLFGAALRRGDGSWTPAPGPLDRRGAAIFVLSSFLTPLLILTAWPSRSPVVGNILVPPSVALAVLTAGAFLGRMRQRKQWRRNAGFVAVIAVCGAIYAQVSAVSRHSALGNQPADAKKIVQLYDDIGVRCVELGWTAPRIAIDRIHDYLYPTIIDPVFYEHSGTILNAQGLLGMGVMPVDEKTALDAIEKSDFAVLTEPGSEEQETAIPFNQGMRAIDPKLFAAAEGNLILWKHVDVFSQRLAIYMKVPIRIDGTSGEWITKDGATLTGPADVLRRRPRIELSGRTIRFEVYHGQWSVTAQLLLPGQPPRDVRATITAPAERYAISLWLNPDDLPASGYVSIHFALDKFFVPKEIGENGDTRALSIMAPERISAAVERILTPPPGSALKSPATFCWKAPSEGLGDYWLDVGTSQGVGNIWSGVVPDNTCKTVANLPAGHKTVWVRLWTNFGGRYYSPRDSMYVGP